MPAAHQPKPCNNKNCRTQHKPAERIALASSLCEERGTQLTKTRKQVLELLWQSDRPLGAYDLIDALRVETGKTVAPPTVYRALEFLMAQNFVTKIESQNNYIPCSHPERRHDCMFFSCTSCGTTVEMEDQRIEKRLADDAAALGFQITRRTVEVEGICQQCAPSAA